MNSNTILNYPWFPKTDPAYGGGASAGEWQGQDQAFLGRIANDLVYERANSQINSLPSPWSRALQIEQAVLNPKYPTRDDLLKELFGGLATVGLWEIIGIKLEAERVDLSQLSSKDDEAVGAFARSLSEQKPPPERSLYRLLDDNSPWNIIHILKVDGLVIGFTSPSTLICPTVHLSSPIQGMRWTADRRFASPTAFLSKQQRQALADWFAYIDSELLKADELGSQSTASALSRVLTEFIRELITGPVGSPVLSERSIPGLPPRPKALSLLARGAGAKAAVSPSMAIVELGERKERPLPDGPAKPVVLVDPEMPSKLGMPANEITLFAASTLEAVGGSKQKLEQLYGREIDVITPDDLFAPDLYLLPGEAALTNTWLLSRLEGQPVVNGSSITPILPLKEKIRDLLSSRELEKACSLRVISNGSGMELELTLMLQISAQRAPYPLVRSFPIKEENLIDDDLPVITVWPNVSEERWKKFYIFCSDGKSGLSVDGFSDYDLEVAREGQQSVKYFMSQRFPDLVKLIEGGRYCGLIPVNLPADSSSTVTTWEVGIDFGTSFTNFFVNDGSSASRKPLDKRLLPLTRAQKEAEIDLLAKFFILEEPHLEIPPISTALNTYAWEHQKAVNPKIYHQARIHWVGSANAQSMRSPKVHTGFKWSEFRYQKPFLNEITLLISCNAAAAGATQISWSVSYPSAFSPREAKSYRKCWSDLCSELRDATGLDHQFIEGSGEGGLQAEAIAFASYFGNFLDMRLVHTACFDVGGGTTDISLWQDNILLHQVSVPFAGRDICTQIMQMKPSFIRILLPSANLEGIGNDEAKLRQEPNFNSIFDSLLRSSSHHLLDHTIPSLRNDQDKQLVEFISLMAISFAGLYHYLGIILKGLDAEKALRLKTVMPVCMGGNGARFMNWLDDDGSFSRDCDIDLLLEAIQVMSSGFDIAHAGCASTTLSTAFKDETACGLVSNGVNLSGVFDPRKHRMFAGENLAINGTLYGVLDRVIEPKDGTVESYEIAHLNELRRFIRNYDEALKMLDIKSLLPIAKLANITRLWPNVETEVRAICLERINKDFEDLEPEPPFISGLKALTRVLSREWAERY